MLKQSNVTKPVIKVCLLENLVSIFFMCYDGLIRNQILM